MKQIVPEQPFYQRQECIASLFQGDAVAEGLHVIIEYPIHRQGEIIGHVVGSKAAFDKIARVSDAKGPSLRFESHHNEVNPYDITSGNVHLRQSSRRSLITDIQGLSTYIVSELGFRELTLKHHFDNRDTNDRHITFFLAGPTIFWGIHEMTESSFTGERTNDVTGKVIELAEPLSFDIEVYPHYLYGKTQPPDDYDVSTRLYAIHFHTSKPEKELSDKNFNDQATNVVEDLLLLASFVSRHWITWLRYESVTPNCFTSYVRQTRETRSESLDFDDTLVAPNRCRSFLTPAFTQLRTLRTKGFDIFMPMVYFISANEAKYVEEQFMTLFLGLERLKDLFARHTAIPTTIISDGEFDGLQKVLSTAIKENIEIPERRSLIYEKLRELNRPAFRSVFDNMTSHYNVQLADLYPPGIEATLVKTRDQLFHSALDINLDHLVKEQHRLRAVVERLLLSMLGWQDFSRAPIEYEKKWLREVG